MFVGSSLFRLNRKPAPVEKWVSSSEGQTCPAETKKATPTSINLLTKFSLDLSTVTISQASFVISFQNILDSKHGNIFYGWIAAAQFCNNPECQHRGSVVSKIKISLLNSVRGWSAIKKLNHQNNEAVRSEEMYEFISRKISLLANNT